MSALRGSVSTEDVLDECDPRVDAASEHLDVDVWPFARDSELDESVVELRRPVAVGSH